MRRRRRPSTVAWTSRSAPTPSRKLLEYNADTPTSLLEGAVIQWTWLGDRFPALDQYNSIHEKLIGAWRDAAPSLIGQLVRFAGCVDSVEDEMTVGYLRDTAVQAGLATVGVRMEDIGWDRRAASFVDLDGRPIHNLFKLYPWEGLYEDDFAPLLARVPEMRWIEPAWKMLLSTKGIKHAHPVGTISGPPEPATRVARTPQRQLRQKAAAWTRREQRSHRRRQRVRRNRRTLRTRP